VLGALYLGKKRPILYGARGTKNEVLRMIYQTEIINAYGPANLFSLSDYVNQFIEDNILKEGFVFLFSTGSTGALVNLTEKDEEPFLNFALKSINYSQKHRHPGNAFAHLRSSFWGTSNLVLVENSKTIARFKSYLFENTAGRKSRRISFVLQGQFAGGGLTNMNVSTGKLPVKANGWIDFVDITAFLEDYITDFGIRDGMLNLSCLDKGSAIITTEYETSLLMDTADFFTGLVKDVKDDSKAPVLSSVIGETKSIPIHEGRLDLGTWQQVAFVDFGKAGEKEVFVQAVGI
jgi:secondary thiamine-phosphate synthase enzyme